MFGAHGVDSTGLLIVCHHLQDSIVEGQGECFLASPKNGSFEFQCAVQHQWIAQPQVGPVSVYCDTVGMSCLICGMSFKCGINKYGPCTAATRRNLRC